MLIMGEGADDYIFGDAHFGWIWNVLFGVCRFSLFLPRVSPSTPVCTHSLKPYILGWLDVLKVWLYINGLFLENLYFSLWLFSPILWSLSLCLLWLSSRLTDRDPSTCAFRVWRCNWRLGEKTAKTAGTPEAAVAATMVYCLNHLQHERLFNVYVTL